MKINFSYPESVKEIYGDFYKELHDFALAEIKKDEAVVISKFTYGCKASIWDVPYACWITKSESWIKLKEWKKWNPTSTCLIFKGNVNVAEIQARLLPLEKLFKFKTTKLTLVDGFLVIDGSIRWWAHVNLISLFLSAIRYGNSSDVKGYDLSIKNQDKLKKWYDATCYKKDIKDGWAFVNGGVHGLGICNDWREQGVY